jgi:hypothetical protein
VFTRDRLNGVAQVPTPSTMVEKHIGVKSVCEAAALLATDRGRLIVPKQKTANVTVAVAADACISSASDPADRQHLSRRAARVLETVDAVAGYTTYIDLIRPLIKDKHDRQHGNDKRGRPGVCGFGPGAVGNRLRRDLQRGSGGLRHGRVGAGDVPGTNHCHRWVRDKRRIRIDCLSKWCPVSPPFVPVRRF